MGMAEILGEKNAMRILVFLLENPTAQYSQKELRVKIKISKATMIKWLGLLIRKDMIRIKKIGVTNLHWLNRENIIVKQLKILHNLLLLEKIRIISRKHEITAYLYGSCARGEDTEDSDIDILIIGNKRKEGIISDFSKISSKIRRKINISVFTSLDWSFVARKDPAFYERVEKDKILLQ
ncbi:nucleotidyltransferase domain-containing protein [Candidatus Woesearchaeota archaeon]|nr:nucleotidyltransferase domain-containing protein [Candidatus Woesearchaeota archaeon]